MERYRKKPVEIEARQWDGTRASIVEICAWANRHDAIEDDSTIAYTYVGEEDVTDVSIWTLEGDMKVSPGDYVIRGVQGEFYPCKPDIFEATYEPVEE